VDRLIERCCGLDVHKATVTACVRVPDRRGNRAELLAEYSTMTADLLALSDWLRGLGVTHVAMEATGVYWKPGYYLLEEDFELLLVNAAHIKHVPGRKTDVQDAQWIAQLLEHGLLRGSFVPPREIRELRDLTRYRKSLIRERQREANRLHKLLEDANIKLASVATDVLGVSGRAMLGALLSGESDPEVLAELARGRLRKKLPALREALHGRFSGHHALLLSRILAHLDYLEQAIAQRARRRSSAGWPLFSVSSSCCARSQASSAAPPRRCWRSSGPTGRASPRIATPPAGPASAPAARSQRASASRDAPARAIAGCERC
jgi:transposase